jgi:phosphopantetheinyl transferase
LKSKITDISTGSTRLLLAAISATEPPPARFYSVQEKAEYYILGSEKRHRERAATLRLLHDVANIAAPLHHHVDGIPYLANSPLRISISHSRWQVAIALHPSNDVGLDVESRSRNFDRIAPRYLSETELSWCCTPLQRCIAWCAKEAVYKALHQAGVDFTKHIVLDEFTPSADNSGDLLATYLGRNPSQLVFLRYTVAETYVVVQTIT